MKNVIQARCKGDNESLPTTTCNLPRHVPGIGEKNDAEAVFQALPVPRRGTKECL